MRARTKLEKLRNKFLEKTATGSQKKLVELTKNAGLFDKTTLKLIGAAAAIPAAGMALGAAQNSYWKKKADQNYDRMIGMFPQLKDYKKYDIKENFEVLKTIAPRFSSIPRLAGPWLLRTMEFHEEGLTPSQFRDVMDVEYARRTSLEPTLRPQTSLIAKALTEEQGADTREASSEKIAGKKVTEMYNIGKREIMDSAGKVIGKATPSQHTNYLRRLSESMKPATAPKIDSEEAAKLRSFMPSLHKSN